ncbi:MAG TPA: hypothetical protein VGK92_13190 [Gaiellales bacterium]
MRAPTRIRHLVLVAAFAATALAPAVAQATQIDVAALNGSFASGDGGWTSTSACAPLCTVTNSVDGGAGASTPGSATIAYSTLAGLLGGLASGTSTWTSPGFTWTSATPDSAVITFARKAAIAGLLAVGGSTTVRVQVRDQTTSTTTVVASETLTAADGSFASRSVAIDPSLLRQGHSYRLLVTTNLSAAALLSNIRVSYDDIGLTATASSAAGGGATGGGGSADPTGSGGGADPSPGTGAASGSGTGTPASGGAALRLAAAPTVRFSPGRRMALRVRATRAGKPVANVRVTLRAGATSFRLITGRDGWASLGLLRRARSALRITFRAAGASATTWARPR